MRNAAKLNPVDRSGHEFENRVFGWGPVLTGLQTDNEYVNGAVSMCLW
jgi:hypothetical protein